MLQKLMTLKARRQATGGFSLLELLLVVAVAAVLILAGISAYTLVSNNQRATDAKRQLAQIKSTIKNNYSTGDYSNLDTTVAGGLGAFTGMRNVTATSTSAPKTPWNDDVSVANSTTSFTITFTSIPKTACVDIAMAVANDQDLEQVQVASNTARTAASGTTASTITAQNLSADCVKATTSSLTWTFK